MSEITIPIFTLEDGQILLHRRTGSDDSDVSEIRFHTV